MYEHPTIASLSRYVYELASGIRSGDPSSKAVDMRSMAEKYSQDFPVHQAITTAKSNGDVVLVTGTTGGLGCYILSQLVSSTDVIRIFALNRKSRDAKSLYDRQKDALIDRGLDPDILKSEKVVLLEGDTSSIGFGVSDQGFLEVSPFSSFVRVYYLRVEFSRCNNL